MNQTFLASQTSSLPHTLGPRQPSMLPDVGLSLLGLALAALVLCSLLHTFKLLYRARNSQHVIQFINNSFTLCAATSGKEK